MAITAPAAADLATLLTPDLYLKIFKLSFPWDLHTPLNATKVIQDSFDSTPAKEAQYQELCYPVLKAFSTIPLASMPDLLSFLPAPTSADFPHKSLALILLFDQGTRWLFSDADKRWVSGFFDILCIRLTKQLITLGPLAPDRKEFWVKELGCTFDIWILIRLAFLAPLVHSESLADQDLAHETVEYLRTEVERESGLTDPYYLEKEKILTDTLGFSRVSRLGPPKGDVNLYQLAFWRFMRMDLHYPIVKKFGRYPYRNRELGRLSTAEEEVWIKETDNFGILKDIEAVNRIREDVLVGRWTPLRGH
jgi:uncharacterized protein (DUF924 family)